MNKKAIIFSIAASLLVVLSLFVSPVKQAVADTTTINGDAVGWMWSSNVGWFKLDSNSSTPVTIVDNKLSGYAWSSSVGWINFDPVTTAGDTYPGSPAHGVQIESDGALSGWARSCSVFASGCLGAFKGESALGGWRGWIKMTNARYDSTTHFFSGYAWGDLNIGWLQFVPDADSIPGGGGGCIPGSVGCPPGCAGSGCGGGGSVTCVASPTPPPSIAIGDPVVFTANPVDDTYTYIWTGMFGDSLPDSSNYIFSTNYPTAGIKTVSVEVKNAEGISLGIGQCKNDVGQNVEVKDCAHVGENYGDNPLPPVCCVGEEDTNDPLDGICGENTCTASIDEQNYGIELTFGSAPLYEGNPRSSVNQKVTLSACSDTSLTASGLPGGASLICSSDQEGETGWGPCSGLHNGDYYVGVTSTLVDTNCYDVTLSLDDSSAEISTEACFRRTGQN
jgi:hypothetical protein